MQGSPIPSLTISQILAYGIVASITAVVAFFSGLITSRIQKQKLPSEIHKLDAEARLATTQAKHVEFQDNLSAGELLSRIFQQLMEANKRSDQLLAELETTKKDVARIPVMEAELAFLNAEVHRARAQGFLATDRGRANPAAGNPGS